jgi:hypothetical protein
MEKIERKAKKTFHKRIRQQWNLMWKERYNDRFRAEGITSQEYPLLFMNRGAVICASRDVKTPNFQEILDHWSSQDLMYNPPPQVGGWGKFIRTKIKKPTINKTLETTSRQTREKQQLRKGGRGWLHIY